MHIFNVALFGHREIDDLRLLDKKLCEVVGELIKTKEYVTFLVGRNGEFDEYAASVIKRLQKELGNENNDILLVLPYAVKDIEYFEKYYDGIIVPERISTVHPKKSIIERNKWMVEGCDLVISYIERSSGGAYSAVRYARKMNKKIVNLCDSKKL